MSILSPTSSTYRTPSWSVELPQATYNTARLAYQRHAPRIAGRLLKHMPYELQDMPFHPEAGLRTHLRNFGSVALQSGERKARESCRVGLAVGALGVIGALGGLAAVGVLHELIPTDASNSEGVASINSVQSVSTATEHINIEMGMSVVNSDTFHDGRVQVRINTCPDNGAADYAMQLTSHEVSSLRQQIYHDVDHTGAGVKVSIAAMCSPTPTYVPGKVVNPFHTVPKS